MAILVVCPGCTARFSVSDQFAGRTGPCPKCKKPITVPKPEAQAVKIHEPEPVAVAAGGKSVTVPFKSLDRPVPPLAFVAGGAGAVVVLLGAWLVRVSGGDPSSPWLALPTAFLVAIPCSAIAYAALRNRELEPFTGSALLVRCLACSAVYTALWAARGLLPATMTRDMWQWMFLGPAFVMPGTLAALVAFELDWGTAAAHFSFYVLFTAMLRWMAGLPPL